MDGITTRLKENQMTFQIIIATIREYKQAGISEKEILTTLLNETFGDWLSSQGVSHLEMVNENRLCLNVIGQLKEHNPSKGIELYSRFMVISIEEIEDSDSILYALKSYSSDGDGAYVWIIPDGYMPKLTFEEQDWEQYGGGYFSHESICISNTADINTSCKLEVLYEDPAMENFSCHFDVPAHRSVHYRLDKLIDANGEPLIAKDAPVSYKVTSKDARIVVQGSRILTSGEDSRFASFGTVMAWCPQ
ncbi:hypothetical protein C6497_01460 [Candidatus Poribacteria bacterium]|nr:MAG: hypothetical protein C6497_01460 [Candidatus Poribacteria bacterium]